MQSLIPQPDRKLRFMLSTRVEKSYAEAVDRLLSHHGGLQFSKYLRGLIYADAVRCGILTANLDRPAWVARSYPELFTSEQRDSEVRKARPAKKARRRQWRNVRK